MATRISPCPSYLVDESDDHSGSMLALGISQYANKSSKSTFLFRFVCNVDCQDEESMHTGSFFLSLLMKYHVFKKMTSKVLKNIYKSHT